jgi:hypothetical protein
MLIEKCSGDLLQHEDCCIDTHRSHGIDAAAAEHEPAPWPMQARETSREIVCGNVAWSGLTITMGERICVRRIARIDE